MKLKTLALMGICASMAFTACKKDDDNSSTNGTTGGSSASIEGTWKMTAMTASYKGGGMDTTFNEFDDMDACEKDDLERFNADKTITSLSGATKCDPSDPDSEPGGTWSLTNNTLIVNSDGSPETYTVLTLNATTLKLQMKETDNGTVFTANITFARQ